MEDIQDLIKGLQELISKADDITRCSKSIDAKMQCEVALAHAYLDKYLNKIERLPRAA